MFVEKFTTDTKRITDKSLEEDKKRIEDDKKKETEFLKPLIEARKSTYEKTKQMRYELTLLENRYHDYIIKNIDDLPKKIAALKKAFEYVRNTKLANKELSLKQKEFYKKQMDDYLKRWNKLYKDGSVKLQSLRNIYRLNLDLSLKKENESRINERLKTLQKQLKELELKLQKAKSDNNEKDINEYTISIDNIKKLFPPIIVKEKEVAVYIQKVDTFYEKLRKLSGDRLPKFPIEITI